MHMHWLCLSDDSTTICCLAGCFALVRWRLECKVVVIVKDHIYLTYLWSNLFPYWSGQDSTGSLGSRFDADYGKFLKMSYLEKLADYKRGPSINPIQKEKSPQHYHRPGQAFGPSLILPQLFADMMEILACKSLLLLSTVCFLCFLTYLEVRLYLRLFSSDALIKFLGWSKVVS